MLRHAQHLKPSELASDQMTCLLVIANMGSMNQASFAAPNMIWNILVSDPERDSIRILHEEANASKQQPTTIRLGCGLARTSRKCFLLTVLPVSRYASTLCLRVPW